MENNLYEPQLNNEPSPSVNPFTTGKKRLFKSRTNYFIDGICGGLAEYSGSDPVIFRVIFSIASLIGGIGVLGYIILGIFLKPNPQNTTIDSEQNSNYKRSIGIALSGSFMIVLGVYFLIRQFSYLLLFRIFILPVEFFLPVFITCSGIFLFVHRNEFTIRSINSAISKLTRTLDGRLLVGICRGFANYLNTDVTIVRIVWLLFSFLTMGLGIVVYIVLAFLIPAQAGTVIEK